ncbi:MAG: hypothetical protein ACYCZU_13935, partial [Devosia sp.]
MPLSSARSAKPAPPTKPDASARLAKKAGTPFFGLIDGVLVDDPVDFEFEGAISRAHAMAVWTWMLRDLAAGLIDPDTPAGDPAALQALDALMPDLLARARAAVAATSGTRDAERRLKAQMGGDEPWERLPLVLNALKCRALLDKARSFGRAVNGMNDEAALAMALQSMPLQDHGIAALLMQAAVGQVANPSRLMTAVIRIAGSPTEAAIQRAGFGPVVDALLAHAQNQIPALSQMGPFADIDLTCRAIDRFHRLIRAVHGFVELGRAGRWAMIVAALTKAVSERVEPKLRDVVPDVNKALRRPREGADRFDGDLLLSALNGVYILATVRDCRDSLALNALFDQTWTQIGQALELHIQRNLEILRQNPADTTTSQRLDAAIKMAELRFNAEYA